MVISLLVLLFLTALFFPKSKLVYFTILVFMWIVFSYNTGAPDRNTYDWIYTENIPGAFEPVFTYLMTFSRRLNLDYVGFRMLLAAIYLFFLHLTYRNVENYKTFALAIYLIAPFPWQVSGIRAALACVIVMYGVSVLIKSPAKNRVKYLCILLLATLVHYSSLLFIVFLFISKKSSVKRIIIFSIIAFVGTVLILNTNLLLEFVSKYTSREKIIGWLSGGKDKEGFPNWKGFLAELVILFGNIYFTMKSKNIIHRYDDGEKYRIVKYIYDLNIITILFVPFLRLNDTYIRLLLVMHGINIISYTMTVYVLQERRVQDLNKHQRLITKPKICFNIFALVLPLWSYFIAVYQNLPFRGTSMSVLEFLNEIEF